jgi:hypothetical protein
MSEAAEKKKKDIFPPWSEAQEDMLLGAVKMVAQDLPKKERWKQIAVFVPGHGRRDCFEKYRTREKADKVKPDKVPPKIFQPKITQPLAQECSLYLPKKTEPEPVVTAEAEAPDVDIDALAGAAAAAISGLSNGAPDSMASISKQSSRFKLATLSKQSVGGSSFHESTTLSSPRGLGTTNTNKHQQTPTNTNKHPPPALSPVKSPHPRASVGGKGVQKTQSPTPLACTSLIPRVLARARYAASARFTIHWNAYTWCTCFSPIIAVNGVRHVFEACSVVAVKQG